MKALDNIIAQLDHRRIRHLKQAKEAEAIIALTRKIPARGKWLDVGKVNLVVGSVYMVRRKYGYPQKLVMEPALAFWLDSGWQDIHGDMYPGFHGTIEVWVKK